VFDMTVVPSLLSPLWCPLCRDMPFPDAFMAGFDSAHAENNGLEVSSRMKSLMC